MYVASLDLELVYAMPKRSGSIVHQSEFKRNRIRGFPLVQMVHEGINLVPCIALDEQEQNKRVPQGMKLSEPVTFHQPPEDSIRCATTAIFESKHFGGPSRRRIDRTASKLDGYAHLLNWKGLPSSTQFHLGIQYAFFGNRQSASRS
jgi:hypothetical protein